MNDEDWSRLRALFDIVLEMAENERTPFLDRELRDEPELRAELDTLLTHAPAAASFLYVPDGVENRTPGVSPAPGSQIGPYQLVDLLGEGGFGVVYLAEQLRPIRRRVALKLIKPGMDTKQVIARFEAERQTLALMDHPGIAQVFDAGATEAGRPYFVMEHVPGVPITLFCDQERLRVRERLVLFLMVCDAVQHAHQKGVIHRDIKPSNILVARRDGAPALKIIDFGIVKATSAAMDDRSFATREGAVLGTLGYMSPEQTGAIEAPVDTRSDIYSLGVLLYELMAGELPFDKERLRQASWTEAVRILREEDPPSLSARLDRVPGDGRVAEIAQRRFVDERTLLRELRGELEWITLRALEKNPDDRYATASDLAADVGRHLANEAVLARAPSPLYRIRKFARRHRVAVAAAALVLASIVGGGVAAGIGFARAVRAERGIRREADSARRVADFLVELFQTADPGRSRGETMTARTLLDQGTRRIQAGLDQDPHVRARLLTTLGKVHLSLGLYDEGLALQREALATSEAARPPDEIEIAGQLRELASGLLAAGRTEEVESLLDRSITIARRLEGPRSASLAAALSVKAEWSVAVTPVETSDSLVNLAIELAETQARPDTLQLIRMYATKARINNRRYALTDAERDYLRALDLCVKSGREPAMAVVLHRQLAGLYVAAQDSVKALAHAEEGVRLARQLYAPNHPNIAIALSGQASALTSDREFDRAAAVREEAVRLLRSNGGRDDLLAWELNNLGLLYKATGRLDLAIACAEECCDLVRKAFGPESAPLAEAMSNLARYHAGARQWDRADSVYRESFSLFDRLDTQSVHAAYAHMGYGNVCREIGRLTDADSHYTRAVALMDTAEVGFRAYVAECSIDHGYLRSLQGRHAEAESLMQFGLAVYRRDFEEFDSGMGPSYVRLAASRARAGNATGAMDALQRAVRCGATGELLTGFPELAALRSRPGFPPELRT